MVPSYIALIPQACFVAAVVLGLRVVAWFVYMMVIAPLSDPMRHLPGPDGSLLESHIQRVMDPELSFQTYKDWRTRYGKTFRFQGFGRHDYRLMTFDIRAISHIMSSSNYEKPWQTRSFLGRLIGKGIFSSEGRAHELQRRIVAPAFSHHSVTRATTIFFRKADEVCDRWRDIIAERMEQTRGDAHSSAHQGPFPVPSTVVDIAAWISRASFDVIGLAGFGYDFHALKDESEEVYCAYRKMFRIADKGLNLWQILELYFPVLRKIFVTDDIRITNESKKIIAKAGQAIVAEKKRAFQEAQVHGDEEKDLLTLLIKSNLHNSKELRLTDEELQDQCSTFLLAGSDSVSTAISWCFQFLAMYPDVQIRLRRELSGAPYKIEGLESDNSMDSGFVDTSARARWYEIARMPLLDHVIRETLRLHPPVHSTIRVALKDDYVPLHHPVTLRNGRLVGSHDQRSEIWERDIKIRKGTYVHIPLEGYNLSQDQWGEDALSFNPDRWKQFRHKNTPSLTPGSNLMTFGYGSSSCLGYRFTIAEMKVFIATILPQFEFALAGDVEVSRFNAIITRPYVKGKWSEGTQMPISIREL
ncbi:cytochrome P450 [Pholiota conissans]|uniref:Cytochrome P450 n=1 Tax=Pholiota conissans TaxID=109636 RepID=A0A9P5YZR1_9AGAR|nr:cytochrome P450 [Pholiota conissans]